MIPRQVTQVFWMREHPFSTETPKINRDYPVPFRCSRHLNDNASLWDRGVLQQKQETEYNSPYFKYGQSTNGQGMFLSINMVPTGYLITDQYIQVFPQSILKWYEIQKVRDTLKIDAPETDISGNDT